MEISIMKDGISFDEVIAIIDRVDKAGNAIPFDIAFRTLQRNSKTGGRLVTYKQVKKYRSKKDLLTKASLLAHVQSPTGIKKAPNHFKNRTRNIALQNGEIKKIHIRLIDSVNGKKMHY